MSAVVSSTNCHTPRSACVNGLTVRNELPAFVVCAGTQESKGTLTTAEPVPPPPITTSQMPVAPCAKVTCWPLVRVNVVAPSVFVEPVKTLKVSGEVRVNVTVPAPSPKSDTTRPGQPVAVESGTVTAEAPERNRRVWTRSMMVEEESHWIVYGEVVTGEAVESTSTGGSIAGAAARPWEGGMEPAIPGRKPMMVLAGLK